jgi:hypothetical protein
MTDSQVFQTKEAARYLASRGVKMSPSSLEKARARGEDDERDRGPDYRRDQRGICFYARSDLDRYAAQRLASLEFRAPARQPENFLAIRKKAPEAA